MLFSMISCYTFILSIWVWRHFTVYICAHIGIIKNLDLLEIVCRLKYTMFSHIKYAYTSQLIYRGDLWYVSSNKCQNAHNLLKLAVTLLPIDRFS